VKHYKILSVILTVITIVLFVNIGNTQKDDGWVFFGTTNDGDNYYDKKSVRTISKNIIRVTTKIKYSKEGRDNLIKLRNNYNKSIAGWDKLDTTMVIYLMNCVYKTSQFLEMIDYDVDGNTLLEYKLEDTDIDHIQSGEVDDALLKMVCQK
jgi:hypothetical protein